MTVANVDIVNRALQLIGDRTTVTSGELIANSSNEAIQANIALAPVRDWCTGLFNWNFARKTAVLSLLKTVGLPPTTWSSTSPAPPWYNEYALPADYLIARYLTNSNHNVAPAAGYDGEPQRFVISTDLVSAVQQTVLLCKEPIAILVYTSQMPDPTLWPWMFERLVVSALAWNLSMVLTGNYNLTQSLENMMIRYLTIAEQANRSEGLQIEDSTPEWIQAIGIPYPNRRLDLRMVSRQEKADDNQR